MSDGKLRHDIVVVGASAGGVEALMRVVGGLPADFAAAVFVVLHLQPESRSALAEILDRVGPLKAEHAQDQQPFEPGRIYVAPPNRHLVVHRGHVALKAGPRENSARPAVDVLFRSAARAYRRRVVGVVLSGTLRDGALGLAAIHMRGGVTIVQDPNEALFAGMPQSALSTAPVDFCLSSADIAVRLVELTHHTFEQQPMHPPEADKFEIATHAADEPENESSAKLPNAASGLTCPECHGSLWELRHDSNVRFECRIGHTYGVDALLAEQGEAVEAALWAAVNSMQERAGTFRRLAGSSTTHPMGPAYIERAQVIENQADSLFKLLHSLIADGAVG